VSEPKSSVVGRLTVNTTTNFAFRLMTAVLGLVSVPVIVTALGAEAFGVLLLASSLVGYFSILEAGFPAGVVKYVAEFEANDDVERVHQTIHTSIAFYLIVGTMVGAAVALFTYFGGLSLFKISDTQMDTARQVLYLAAAFALLRWPLSTFGHALEGLQRYDLNNLANGVAAVVSMAGAIALAIAGAPLTAVFACQSSGVLLAAILQIRFLRTLLPRLSFSGLTPDREVARRIFGYGGWIVLGQISRLLIYQTDRIILALFLPVSSLTVYHVVTTPFRTIQELSGLFNSALVPAVSAEQSRGGDDALDRFTYVATRYGNAFFSPLAVVGVFLSAPFIGMWMGPDYLPYAWIAQLACLFQLLWQSNATLMRVFMGSGRVRETMLISLFVASINIPLGIWWVQLIGVAGVVFSTVVAGIISIPLQYRFAMPKIGVDRSRYFWSSVVSGQSSAWVLGLCTIPLWAALQSISTWPTLIATAVFAAMVFYLVAWKTIVTKEHRSLLRNLLQPTGSN
jgi:O-antigen/teichoic acid export membrane protein